MLYGPTSTPCLQDGQGCMDVLCRGLRLRRRNMLLCNSLLRNLISVTPSASAMVRTAWNICRSLWENAEKSNTTTPGDGYQNIFYLLKNIRIVRCFLHQALCIHNHFQCNMHLLRLTARAEHENIHTNSMLCNQYSCTGTHLWS